MPTCADVDRRINCPNCGHRFYQHRRWASGAYRCNSFGCGCERASVPEAWAVDFSTGLRQLQEEQCGTTSSLRLGTAKRPA